MGAKSLRNILIVLVVIVIVAMWYGYSADNILTDAEQKQPSHELKKNVTEITTTSITPPDGQLTENKNEGGHSPVLSSSSKPVEITYSEQNCIDIAERVKNHSGRTAFLHWYRQELEAELDNSYYQTLSIDQLVEQAQAADVLAMRMLAERYLTYARYQHFSKPAAQHFSERLDRSALAQARYWAEQAALHGYGGAFMSLLAMSYMVELEDINRQLEANPAQVEILHDQQTDVALNAQAYLTLSVELMPQLHEFLLPLRTQLSKTELSTEEQARFDEIYPKLRSEWRGKRALLGLPAELEFNIPVEVEQYIQLENELHNCNSQLAD
ncbi:hypothetical protein [Arsukibacterium sp.]|uniref:hypothetical protein n=1 Tax=Arsukibacterium sp. TaxID=1977258 RepID=UPI001BD4E7F2|nr:hypothetical protein [Arsukibacterium sp.]